MTIVWLVFAIMTLGVILYLAPAFVSDLTLETDVELASYLAQIDAINNSEDMDPQEAADALAVLKRQVLARQAQTTAASGRLSSGLALLAIAVIGGSVYYMQGRPDLFYLDRTEGALNPAIASTPSAPSQTDRDTDVDNLISQLEARLADDRADDPNGWLLYARSLMNLGRFSDALDAYDRVVTLTDSHPEAVDERERARAFVEQRGRDKQPIPPSIDARPQRGPTEADVRDAQQMSEVDRQAMINGMVEGLAARLDDNPDDADGWARLIRARLVLGQSDKVAADVAKMRIAYTDHPDTAQKILDSAGYSD